MAKISEEPSKATNVTSLFFMMGLDMSWRLALGVLIPLIGGAELDKLWHTSPLMLIIGFVLAVIGSVITIRRTLRLSSQITFPASTKARKQEDDDDD